jgi:PAS domain S-box-containing protein
MSLSEQPQAHRFEESLTADGRYRLLVDAVTDYAIYMLNVDGIVSSWNPGARRFKGYEESEIVGQHFSRFYTPEDRATGLPERALAAARDEGKFEGEGWRVRKDGERFWARVIIDPIRNRDGDLVGYAKITRDLTERGAAESALRSSHEQFKLLVQGVTDYSIYLLSTEGLVASWNAGAQRIKGYSPRRSSGSTSRGSTRMKTEKTASRSASLRRPLTRDDARKRVGVSARTGSGSGPMW